MDTAHTLKSAPVGRLAPSPTGLLHLGHARSFLLAWWSARSRGGRVLLRIEDLDVERTKPGMREACLRDLEWLGLDWDGEPLMQSADTRAMAAACDALVARGEAYPCTCTRAEIAQLSAPHAGEDEPRYPGTCAGRWGSIAEAEAATGRKPLLRLDVSPGEVEVRDAFCGVHRFDVAATIGDFPIRRRDGAFAYQLAVVVDDARTGVTEVVRGDDLLPSAARQSLLQARLGLAHPTWVHVPLVVGAGGERLAKRAGALALAALREEGVDPRAIVAWAARASGQETSERATPAEIAARFDLQRVPHAPVRLDPATLDALRAARASR